MNKIFLGILVIVIVGIYVLFPLDVIPDIIPILGWIDDFAVLIGGIFAWWRL